MLKLKLGCYIWFGRRYCHWGLKTKSLVNGLQLGMGRIRLIRFCLGTHICSRNWMASSFLLLSMVSISRSISRACGKASNEKPMRSIWLQCNRPTRWVGRAKKKESWKANTLSWPVKKKRKIMTGQHFELASEIYEKQTADVWPSTSGVFKEQLRVSS